MGMVKVNKKIFLLKNFMRLSLLILFPILILLVLMGKKNLYVFKFYFYQVKGFLKGFING